MRPRLFKKILLISLMSFIAVLMFIPFIWMISTSFKFKHDVFRYPPQLIPEKPTLDSYERLTKDYLLWSFLGNPIILSAVAVCVAVGLCSLWIFLFGAGGREKKRVAYWIFGLSMLGLIIIIGIPIFMMIFGWGWNDKTPYKFMTFLRNTLIVSVSATCGVLVCCAMAGYAFARLEFPGRRTIFWLFLASMMVPGIVTIIPVFSMVTSWGWADKFYGLIVPSLSSAYGVFMLRQFFQTLPKDIEDAARVDGASDITVFTRVVLPLAKPGLITLAVLTFVANWTEFLWPFLITSSLEMRTLEVGLSLFYNPAVIDWPAFMAASLLTLLPVVIIFIFTHRFFIRGIALSGMKG